MNDLSEIEICGSTTTTLDTTANELISGYRAMVVGRRLDQQATNLAKQGYLSVYPSSLGQEACQVAAALALESNDWLFPTYRDTVAIISRGVEPVEALVMLRGDWHCGFNPKVAHTAPHVTPLATQAAHAVGLAVAARYSGDDAVALVLCGEGATSEGDFHEAVNLAAVFDAPVIFFVQNNGYAISVPAHRQFRARSIAEKAVGYGIRGIEVDGNDFFEAYRAVRESIQSARAGAGPVLIEARTYRMAPHTNSDDPSLYRDPSEALEWQEKDPILRLETTLKTIGLLDQAKIDEITREANVRAAEMRKGVMAVPPPDVGSLFANVYATLPPHLIRERNKLMLRETQL